ncbi:MAG: thioredoxin domain-containing protein [Gemmatimonas sp.]
MMPNRLAAESSPYLRQHAENPVDWYPWGEEAFSRARAEDKAVLLSVGYAACHWCHVMAHESFEDDATAAMMNELFVNVKVDREERPDVDSIYMQAVQAMVGHGGWPMTVVLTPDGHPFWGGTYFPHDDRPGMPSFKRVLQTVAAAWRDKRDTVVRTTDAMRELFENSSRIGSATGELSPELLARAFRVLQQRYDPVHGGFEGAPKFPGTMALDFCLRWHANTGDAAGLDIARNSFLAMARGGIYDQIGGGFARYSVDAKWLVPHFEKMLYDNALLARLGVHLWQVTRDDEIRRVTEETLAWIANEMTSPDVGFYSSLDADSEGHEGKFYVWDAADIDQLLGADGRVARMYWNIQSGGNFEGKSILHVPTSIEIAARRLGMTTDDVRAAIDRAIPVLHAERATRVRPGLDDKILAGWNGMMTRALAEAARVFGNARWRDMAVRNGEFLRDRLVENGRVTRVFAGGSRKGPGFLEDHAAVALAFFSLHELTLHPQWLTSAREVATAMQRHYRDEATGAWYDTADDGETLITRPRDLFDNATPSGPALALETMLRLSELDGDEKRRSDVLMQLATLAEPMSRWPNGFGHTLAVTDLALSGAVAVALVGEPASPGTTALSNEVAKRYLPRLVLASAPPGNAPVPLLESRPAVNGVPTAYVCRGFSCDLPATDTAELARQLDAACRPSMNQSA